MNKNSGKILIVDDEPANLKLLQQILSSSYRTAFTTNSLKVLEIAEKLSPDIILLDVMMPEMDGFEVLKKLKSTTNTREIPVIFLTSMNQTEDEIKGIKAGAIDYITKPVNADLVLARVFTHMTLKLEQDKNKILLEKTLSGIISLLTDFLSMTNPGLLKRANQLGKYAENIARFFNLKDIWKYRLAAVLSQIGNLMLPEQLVEKLIDLTLLTEDELRLYNSHLLKSVELLSHIPYFEEISRMIAKLSDTDCELLTFDEFKQVDIEISGSKILKIIREYDILLISRMWKIEALEEIKKRKKEFEPFLVTALEKALSHVKSAVEIKHLEVANLQSGMVIHQDLISKANTLLMKKGMEISSALLKKLEFLKEQNQLPEKIEVLVIQK